MFSWKCSKIFWRAIFMNYSWIAVSEFIGNYRSSWPLLSHLYMVIWAKWVGGWPILKINLSIIGWDGNVLRYGFVGRVDGQSILMKLNLFLHVDFMYYTNQSFFSNYSFQLNWIIADIPEEDHSKTLIKFVLVLRHQTIITKSQTAVGERQKLLQGGAMAG